MRTIHPRLAPSRIAFMRDLEHIGIGEPKARGRARYDLLKLGWIDVVLELHDGRKLTRAEFDAQIPPSAERWECVRLVGVTLTAAGRAELANGPTQTPTLSKRRE